MAQLRNTTISDTGSLNLPAGTTAQRPASPVAGQIRYNTTINDTEYYDGGAWRPISDSNPEATGGTIIDTDIGGIPYRIHTFTATGNSTFTVSKGGEVEYLIVAGGGGGGGYVAAGGGGAGGVLQGTTTVASQAYTITVGAGGSAGPVNRSSNGGNGGNSSVFGLTAIGGGGGGRGWSLAAGNSGGSAGGTGGGDGASGAAFLAGVAGTAGQGNAGGGGRRCTNNSGTGGGGGGAGSVGTTPVCSPRTAGRGGQGIVSAITGTNNFYAGGGSGDSYNPNIQGQGGLGGGGNSNGSQGSKNGSPNTGGGAGSAGNLSGDGGAGGSGIVVVRYRRNASTATNPDRIETSTLPLIASNNLEDIFVSRTSLLTYVDAGKRNSYPGSGTTWTDLSGNGFNGSLVDGPFFVNESRGIIRFDGINDRIHFASPSNRWAWTPSSFGLNTLSFEMWTRSTDTSGRFVSRPWNGSGQYNYWITHDSWYVAAGATTNSIGFSSLSTGNWEHIVAIVTSTAYAVYRNGLLDAGFTNHNVTGAVPSAGNAGLPMLLMSLYPYGGGWGGNTGFSIQGDVAIFRAYNRILSADEVLSHYQSERARFSV